MKYTVLLGRIFYSLIFILNGLSQFTKESIQYALTYDVPASAFLVPTSGLIAIVGGVCILIGYKARFGAWLLVLFLIPVSILMHRFWTAPDAPEQQLQLTMFLKNLSMLGGALLIVYFGAGPISVDDYLNQKRLNKTKAEVK